MNKPNIYEAELSYTMAEFPKFKVKDKESSWFMKVLAFLLFFNKDFMKGFITTIGNTMWVPKSWWKRSHKMRAAVVRHERIHLRQQRRYGMFVYSLMYLVWPCPVIWALGRTRLEQEAYGESLRAYFEYYGEEYLKSATLREDIVAHFTSGEYGWMRRNRKVVEAWYDRTVEGILAAG